MNPLDLSRARRRLGGAALAAGAALLLSGCYGITDQHATQQDGVGDVSLVTDLCVQSGSPNATRGEDGCVTTDSGAAPNDVQIFVSYLLAYAVDDPELDADGGPLSTATFTKVSDETNVALTGDLASEPGFRWVSYASSPLAAQTNPARAAVTATLDTEGTFEDIKVRTATSWRFLDAPGTEPRAELAATRPVTCGSPYDPESTPSVQPSTSCTSSQFPVDQRRIAEPDEDTPLEFHVIPTNRLEVLGPQFSDGTLPTFTAGTTAKVTFGQISNLIPETTPITVPVSGTSEIPGAIVESRSSLVIGSDVDLSVNVTIPESTPAGDYKVGVDAGERTGARSAWQLIHVDAAPAKPAPPVTNAPAATTPAPAPTVGEKLVAGANKLADKLEDAKKTRALRKGAATLPFDVPSKGFVRVSLLGKSKPGKTPPVLAVGTAEADGSGPVDVKLKRTAVGRKLFASGKPVEGSIVVRFWGPAGKTVSTAVGVTLD